VDSITNTAGVRREADRTNKWKAQVEPRDGTERRTTKQQWSVPRLDRRAGLGASTAQLSDIPADSKSDAHCRSRSSLIRLHERIVESRVAVLLNPPPKCRVSQRRAGDEPPVCHATESSISSAP
jgi:hypothetical protein